MVTRHLSLALFLPGLLVIAGNVETALAQQRDEDWRKVAENMLAATDRELGDAKSQVENARNNLAAMNTQLNRIASGIKSHDDWFAKTQPAYEAAKARGDTGVQNPLANEWNNVREPRKRALQQALLRGAERYEALGGRLAALERQQVQLESRRNRMLQLGTPRLMELLKEKGGKPDKYDAVFDAGRGRTGPIRTPDVPPVGPSGPVSPQPQRRR